MKKYRKRLCAATALILALVIVMIAVVDKTEVVYAHETFSNVTSLVDDKIKNKEEFLVLEIVDDLDEASMGYLVKGQEPFSQQFENLTGEDQRNIVKELQRRGLLVEDENSDQSTYPLAYEA